MRGFVRSALAFGLIALASAVSVRADVVTLTFEGMQDNEQVMNYYNGGLAGNGSGPGPNYGITFGTDALALNSGNYANNPSQPGVLFFLEGPGAIMNVAAGFDTGFSFYYSAAVYPGIVTVYDGMDGTGNILAQLDLPVTPTLPPGSPTYNNWVPIGVSFAGIAKSVNFSGTANYIGFDNVTLGSATPSVPEPSSMALAGLACLGGLVYRVRRRAVTA